jgi:hypothetical protein
MATIGTYSRDPTTRWTANSFAKAVLTPAGAGTMRVTWDATGTTTAQAWGDGAEWLLDRLPHWVGLRVLRDRIVAHWLLAYILTRRRGSLP